MCNIAIYDYHTTLLLKSAQTSDLWQQLELAFELELDLRDTVHWNRKWFLVFNAWKTQVVLFDQSNNSGVINVKMDLFVLEKK